MANDHSTAHIIQSLFTNLLIAVAKAGAAVFTGSGAMLAEAIHSGADCGNQMLLLLGVKAAAKPADEDHPLGHGRALYFWSFMVALLLFTGGGVFSVYEGLHKMAEPHELEYVGVAVLVLLFSLGLEGYATYSNIKEIDRRRKSVSFAKYLHTTKDSDLIVVFGENMAATLGLVLALVTLMIAWISGNPWWDGLGSLLIGGVLIIVAVFLAVEVRSLLLGETADAAIAEAVTDVAGKHPSITRVLRLISLQQGPGQVLLMMKMGFKPELTVGEVSDVINQFEDDLRLARPEIKWCFVEPDRPRAIA